MVYFIKEMPSNERPRERLIAQGPGALSNSELLAILLETGTKSESVIDLSKRLLYEIDKTSSLNQITYHELIKINGIKMAKACKIIAAVELGTRLNIKSEHTLKTITEASDVYHLVYPNLVNLQQEVFIALYLNTQNEVITSEKIFKGTLNQILIHPREIFKRAYQLSANSVILIHNHPSGNSTPSSQDIEITKAMIEVGELLQIEVLDHIIIGKNEFYSIRKYQKTIL